MNIQHRFLQAFVTALFSFAFLSATSAQTPSPTPAEDDRPVKITTALVQLDVQAVGKDGKPVTGLTAADFSIFQDGKQQDIVSVTYMDEKSSGRTTVFAKPASKADRKITAPPSNIRSRQGRIITFVLDDGNCLATPLGTLTMRDGMRLFIETKMLPDDRVAVYRTAGGTSLLQAYTSNKEVLRRLARKVSLLRPGGCGSTFDPLRDDSTVKASGEGARTFESAEDKARRNSNESRERRNQVVGTIGVLDFVVDRLKNIPQRKTIFLMSEGIIANISDDTHDRLRELADKAARSSVVIHTLSNKGVSIPGQISAQDEVLPGIYNGPDNVTAAVAARINEERSLNEGLQYLAEETGGKFVRNVNRLETAVERILESQSAYYLIAYEPNAETFRGKAFHKIEIKTQRPDVLVSSRKGFYGRSDVETRPVYKSADSPLYQAIASPFSESGMDVRMTLFSGHDDKTGSYIRTLLHISGKDLSMVPDGPGKKASFDVMVVVLDEKGKVAGEFNRTYPIKIPQQGVATVEQNGIDFSTDLPVKKPGVYSFRLAVRNNNSSRLGSAGEMVEVPEIKGKDLLLSGLVTTSGAPGGPPAIPAQRPLAAAFEPVFTQEGPAVRRYSHGSSLAYVYSIYNASNAAPGQRQLFKVLKLFRDGVPVAETPEEAIKSVARAGDGRIDDHGNLRITNAVQPGEYVLQVIVRDKASNKVATQWIDFEVIN